LGDAVFGQGIEFKGILKHMDKKQKMKVVWACDFLPSGSAGSCQARQGKKPAYRARLPTLGSWWAGQLGKEGAAAALDVALDAERPWQAMARL
jgi:hypothetical protein